MREMYQNCIKALRDDGQMDSKVFGAVSELSRRNNSQRNVIATEMMVKFVKKTLTQVSRRKRGGNVSVAMPVVRLLTN
jgi:hypothetical protein